MRHTQDEIFCAHEGNEWFDRNRGALEKFDSSFDLPSVLINYYGLKPKRILEVGAANGFRLAALRERYECKVVAVEASDKAIADGKVKFPFVDFTKGVAHDISLRDSFDLIIVNFVFHWIDRSNLLKCVSEIDRLLGNKGFLIIGDFFPSNFVKVRYHHLPQQEVYTYKQNYAAVFLASGLYHAVAALTSHHATIELSSEVPEDERTSVCLLQKELSDHYTEFVMPLR
jgi:SAM-dependent methyltransferase